MMKKHIYTLIALTSLFTACDQAIETYTKSETGDGSQFTATISNDLGVRTSLSYSNDSTESIVSWVANDTIAVNTLKYSTSNTGTTATFNACYGIPMPPYHAFYPASLAQTNNRFRYPDTVTFIAGKANTLPMYAYSRSSSTLSFKNIFGVLELTLPDGISVSKIEVQNGSNFLTGIFNIDTLNFGLTKYVGAHGLTSGKTKQVIRCNNQSSTDTKFLVALPPATYDYLTITVYTSVNDEEHIVMSRTKHNVTIIQNEIKPITLTDYFYIEAVNNGEIYLDRQVNAHKDGIALEYSTDGKKWLDFYVLASGSPDPTTNRRITTSAGTRYFFRAKDKNSRFGYTRATENQSNCVYQFRISGNVRIGGNILYLLKNDGKAKLKDGTATMKEGAFSFLFEKHLNNSIDASALILPNYTAPLCYASMFSMCRCLTKAPALPALEAAEYCYHTMFHECYSLTDAPSLPATTLGNSCYGRMFEECYILASIPDELPATSLKDSCYYRMFYDCEKIQTAPKLNAETLTTGCYCEMFKSCAKLSSVKMLATTVSATDCLTDWLTGAGTNLETNQIPGLRINNTITSIDSGTGQTIANNTPTNWSIYNDTKNGMQLNPLGYGNKPLTNN